MLLVKLPRKSIPKRVRLAHHEAGHAVLSAAINDAPHLVSICRNGKSLGRFRYRMEATPEKLVQVHLAGFAAEELVAGCQPRRLMGPELRFSIVAQTEPSSASIANEMEDCDQYLAVRDILATGCSPTRDAVLSEIRRLYMASRDSLAAVW